MRSSENNLLTISLIFFIFTMLSTKAITAMQKGYYRITVENVLLCSTIKVLRPWETEFYTTYLTPSSSTTFLLPKDNDTFTIYLLECYHESLFHITATKDKETFYISPLCNSPKEKTISINSDNQELCRITAFMNPAKYLMAKRILLKKLES